MTDIHYWTVFLTAAFIINISPGPDIMYILSRTFSSGRKAGFCSSLGVCTGALFHITLVAFGLSAILSASVMAFTAIKTAGAVYLFYLGVKSFMSKGNRVEQAGTSKVFVSPLRAFGQGILVDILNPKVAMFFIAFIPQFIRPQYGSFASQTFILGGIIIVMGLVVEGAIILLADKAVGRISEMPSVAGILDKIAGCVLIGLGINLFISEPGN